LVEEKKAYSPKIEKHKQEKEVMED